MDPIELERAAYLLADLRRRGFVIEVDGDRLTVTPGSQLTPGDSVEIREYKPLLVELLSKEPQCLPQDQWTADEHAMVNLANSGAFQWWYPGIVDHHMTRTGRGNHAKENQYGEEQSESGT
jgi:hypothetical protein